MASMWPASSSAWRSLAHGWPNSFGGPVNGFGDVTEVLFDMEAVDDLDGAQKHFLAQLPDPRSAVAEHDAPRGALEAAAPRFAAPTRLANGERRAPVSLVATLSMAAL
jgi:hypothetical protein